MAEKILNKLTQFEKWITFGAFMILVTVMFADVALRELTGAGLHWSRQIGVYANLFVVMFGLGVALTLHCVCIGLQLFVLRCIVCALPLHSFCIGLHRCCT